MRLSTQGLGLSYGPRVALHDVSLELASGEKVGLLGPNGAGKTSLIDCLGGQSRATHGRIHLQDQDITKLAVHRRAGLGMQRTFQHLGLVPSLSVLENVQLGLALRPSLNPAQRKEIAIAALHKAGFRGDWTRTPNDCSRFAQKSVALARVIVAEPRVVLLDEPGAGLQQEQKRRLADLLLTAFPAVTLLIVEHDVEFLSRVSTRTIFLSGGRIVPKVDS